jgi:hypothetical protein
MDWVGSLSPRKGKPSVGLKGLEGLLSRNFTEEEPETRIMFA